MQQILDRPIFQYAYFVQDLDEAAMRWVKLFGAGPFYRVWHHTVTTDPRGYFRYRGDPRESDVSYAFGYCGPVQIQLIQQHDDEPSIYSEMFGKGQEGFHHVGILSAELERDKAAFQAEGLDLAVEMWSVADVVYFNAVKQIGCFVEIHGDNDGIREVFRRWKHAHDTWDRQTDPLR
jgi:hypothetical protein